MTRMNNSNILKIGIWIVALAFAAGGFYLLVNFRLDVVEANVIKTEEDVENIDAKMDMIEDTVLIMQYDLRYIKNEMIEQKEISKQILMELRK
jgi:hypothetical protein